MHKLRSTSIVKIIFCFIFSFVAHAFTQEIPLVWQFDRFALSWEEDWLCDILHGIEFRNVEDGHYNIYINNSIVIFSSYHNTEGCIEYFEEMQKRGYKFGIINLSDEMEFGPTSFYPYALFVFRNYWRNDFDNQKNVIQFPLGYGPGFWKGGKQTPNDAFHREYTWSFAGMIRERPTRAKMIENMKKIPNYFFLETNSWGKSDPKSLTVQECRDIMLKTVFIPCPGGKNMDSFRIYEALECGCIPIVEKFPHDYFRKFYPDHPFIVIDSWDEAPAIIQHFIERPDILEKKRLECYTWWIKYKQNLSEKLVSTIKQELHVQ